MADSTVTGFPAGTALTGSEYFGCDQAGATNRVTANMLRTFVLTTPSITGNLAVTGSITGGSINSTPIGATTPSTGSFTTLSTSGNSVIGGGVSTFTRTRDLTIRGTSNDGASVSVDLAAIGSSGTATYHIGYGAGTGWDINYATSDDQLKFYKNASTAVIAAMTSSGLAVTGNISSSGRTLVGTTTDDGVNTLQVNGSVKATGINSTPIGATTPSTGVFTSLTASGNVNTSGSLVFGTANFSYISANTTTANLTFNVSGGVTVGTFTPSGLAVTGNTSTTGRALVGTTTDDGVNALQVNGTAKTTSIKFANTGGTKQALDYYEEGTWIPNGVGLVITGSPGYSGTYTRIGRTVYITGAVTGAATIGLVAGATISTNLPFTATTGIHVLGAVNGTALTSTTLAAQTVSLYATTAFTSGTAFYFSGTYAI